MAQIQGEKGYIVVPKESSRCISVKVVSPIGEETFNEQTEDNVLVYEMRDFAEIYRTKDVAKRDRLMDMTCRAMKWLERARKDGGVFFEGEK
jgi:predicted dehydrogenase